MNVSVCVCMCVRVCAAAIIEKDVLEKKVNNSALGLLQDD